MNKKVTITVELDGTTKTDFEGFDDLTCLDEADRIDAHLKALGLKGGGTKRDMKRGVGAANTVKAR